jgi:outer membrane protein TolC
MRSASYILAITTGGLLAACVSGDYSRAQLQQQVAAGVGSELGNAQIERAEWPPGVSVTDGLSADEAAAAALWNNPAFRAKLSSLELARADLAEARSLADPGLSVVFPGNSTDWKATVSWPLRLLQMPWRVRGARLNADSTVQLLIVTGQALERDAREAHAALLLARDLRTLRGEDARLAATIQSIAQAQFDAGRISRSELERLTVEAVTADSLRLEVARGFAHAENYLLQLIGRSESQAHVELFAETPTASIPSLETALNTALTSRAELHAAHSQLAHAGESVGMQRAELLNLTALIDLEQPSSAGVNTGPGVAVSLPILNANRAGRMRARAELERAAQQLVAVRQQVAAEVRTEHAALTAAVDAYRDIQQRAIPASESVAKQLDERMQGGRESTMSVMQVRRSLFATRIAEATAAAAVRQSAARLAFATGN